MSRFTYYYIKYVLIPCVLLLSITLFFSFTSHGASDQTYFPIVQNANNSIPNNVITYFQQHQFVSNCHFVLYGPYNSGILSGKPYYDYYFIRWDSSGDSSIRFVVQNDGHTIYVQKNGNVSNFNNGLIRFQTSNNSLMVSMSNGSNVLYSPMIIQSSSYNPNVSWISNFDVKDTSDNVLLFLVAPIEIPDGDDPTAFDDTGLGLDSSLFPNTVPTVPSSYSVTIPTAPTWDSSQPVQSVWNYLTWGFDILKTLLQGVITKISEWLQYLGSLIGYVIQKILDYLKAIVQWLYNQFLNWLTPYLKIWSFISGLLFNEDEQLSIFDVLFNLLNFFISWCGSFWSNSWFSDFFTNLVSSYQTIQGYFEDLQSFFSKVVLFFITLVALGTVNGEFSFPVLFQTLFLPSADSISLLLLNHDVYGVVPVCENILTLIANYKLQLTPSSSDDYKIIISSFQLCGQTIDQMEIDFSWYLDFKNYGDPIISAFLVFGYFMWLHSRFPYWLRGQQGDISKATQEISK